MLWQGTTVRELRPYDGNTTPAKWHASFARVIVRVKKKMKSLHDNNQPWQLSKEWWQSDKDSPDGLSFLKFRLSRYKEQVAASSFRYEWGHMGAQKVHLCSGAALLMDKYYFVEASFAFLCCHLMVDWFVGSQPPLLSIKFSLLLEESRKIFFFSSNFLHYHRCKAYSLLSQFSTSSQVTWMQCQHWQRTGCHGFLLPCRHFGLGKLWTDWWYRAFETFWFDWALKR